MISAYTDDVFPHKTSPFDKKKYTKRKEKAITQMINGGTARRDTEGCSQEKDKWGGVGSHSSCI